MKIDSFVVDTNVLISAFLLTQSISRKVFIHATEIGTIASNSISFSPTDTITACRDPKDNKFLELAVSANAPCIITGDKDLLSLNPFRDIPIVSASDFLNMTF